MTTGPKPKSLVRKDWLSGSVNIGVLNPDVASSDLILHKTDANYFFFFKLLELEKLCRAVPIIMSLYYEGATVLSQRDQSSFSPSIVKTRVFSVKKGTFKSSPGQLYALILESVKFSTLLSSVIENSGILEIERKVSYYTNVLAQDS
jgi:hypothetical protein